MWEGLSGTCIKEPWTKPKGGRIKSGKWGWLGWGRVVGERQLYLNDKKVLKKEKCAIGVRGKKEHVSINRNY